MPYQHAGLFVLHPTNDKLDTLKTLLHNADQASPGDTDYIPFDKIESLHFARLVLLEPDPQRSNTPRLPTLILSTNHDDSSLGLHIYQLADQCFDSLHAIVSCCKEGQRSLKTVEDLTAVLRENFQETPAFYIGHQGLSVEQIQHDGKLYDCIQHFIDEQIDKDPEFA